MRKFILGLAAAAAVAFQVSAASASPVTFNWTYHDLNNIHLGGGTLTANLVSAGTYDIASISGTADGNTVLGLDTYDLFNLPGGQQLFFPANRVINSIGFSFNTTGGAFNIYEDDGLYAPGSPFACGIVYCLKGPGTSGNPDGSADDLTGIEFKLSRATNVPEPLTLSLFGAGLAGAAALRRRKAVKA